MARGMATDLYDRYRRAGLLNMVEYAGSIRNEMVDIVMQGDARRANSHLQRKLPSFHAARHEGFKSLAEYWAGRMVRDYSSAVREARAEFDVKPASWFKVEDVVSILEALQKEYGITSILDPFAGWGARATGALMCGMPYVGMDANPLLVHELKEVFAGFSGQAVRFVEAESFSFDFKPYTGADCAFSCPPYWRAEDYGYRVYRAATYKAYLSDMVRLCCRLASLPGMRIVVISLERFRVGNDVFDADQDLMLLASKVGFQCEARVYREVERTFHGDTKEFKYIVMRWDGTPPHLEEGQRLRLGR